MKKIIGNTLKLMMSLLITINVAIPVFAINESDEVNTENAHTQTQQYEVEDDLEEVLPSEENILTELEDENEVLESEETETTPSEENNEESNLNEEIDESDLNEEIIDESNLNEEVIVDESTIDSINETDEQIDQLSDSLIQPVDIQSIETVTELIDALANAAEGDVLTLSSSFQPGDVELNLPNVSLTLDANNVQWTTGSIVLSGNSDKEFTIKNLKMDGTLITNTLFTNRRSAGVTVIDHSEFKNATKGAMNISTNLNSKTIVKNTKLVDNYASNMAPAIFLGDQANLELSYVTILNSIGAGMGYETGAISSKNNRGTITINNSVFRNNHNKSTNNAVAGGGGGAIALHYFRGTLNIDKSYFVGNMAGDPHVEVKGTYDGGAIYLIDARDGAVVNIDQTTFAYNQAMDDAGAIMFQGTGNPGLTTTISNSTFYENVALGGSGGNRSGGAIQYFKNGGSSQMTNTITGSTFIGNQSGNENSTVTQQGGAIGLSGAGFLATPSVTRNGSLFLSNKVFDLNGNEHIDSKYKDISGYTAVQAGTLNVLNVGNVDSSYTMEDILGKNNVMLSGNSSSVTAGVDGEIVPTITIKPGSIAENTYTGSAALGAIDQIGNSRYLDHGAIEISWIKYDANGGLMALPELQTYKGKIYYEANESDEITDYYSIGAIGSTSTIVGDDTLQLTKDGYTFKGWSLLPDGAVDYLAGSSELLDKDNITLYAVWEEIIEEFTMTYDGNENTGGSAPIDSNQYFDGDEVEVLTEQTLVRDGYEFVEWNTSKEGTGVSFFPGDKFNLTEDTILYAQWQPSIIVVINETVKYDANGATSGVVPQETTLPEGTTYTVVGNTGNLALDNHEFAGWNTLANGTGTSYSANDTFILSEDVVLYAQWTPVAAITEYTVSYNANGATSGIVPNGSNMPEGSTYSVLGNTGNLTLENNVFSGWNTLANGTGTSYSANDTFTLTENVVLYAQWTPVVAIIEYTVTYHANGATTGIVPGGSIVPEGTIYTVLGNNGKLSLEGNKFTGWNTKEDGSGLSYIERAELNLDGDINLYAQWEKIVIKDGNKLPATGLSDDTLLIGFAIILVGSFLVLVRKKQS